MTKISQDSQPICIMCKKNTGAKRGISKKGFQKYSKYCNYCRRILYNVKDETGRRIGYRIYKKDFCEKCGFIPENKCQLDVDHIDNNKHNNEISNLQTLCANCHRLKSFNNKKR